MSEVEKLAVIAESLFQKPMAAELRRLAAVEQELEALKRAIRDAEPDAWLFLDKDPLGGNDDRWLAVTKSDFKDGVNPADHFAVEPLYTLKGIK